MKLIRSFILSLIFFVALNINATVSFNAQNPGTILEGEKFQITFTLQGGAGENFHGPQLNNCKLISDNNVYTSSSYTNINGQHSTSSRVDYICVYYAEKIGKVTVPSVTIIVDGKQYKTQPITFEIKKNNGKPNQHISQLQSITSFEEDLQISPKEVASNAFIKIILSKNKVYEQEPIECQIKLYTRYKLKFRNNSQISLDKFLIEDIPVNSNNVVIEEYKGKEYNSVVIRKFILFPQESGRLKISTGKYSLEVAVPFQMNKGGFMFNQQQNILIEASDSTNLEVLPLPSPQPANFSGAVGKYNISTELSPSSIKTNEIGTLSFIITGQGNIKYIKEPLINFPDEFELYEPKYIPNVKVVGSNLDGIVTYDYSFMPLSIGNYQIPKQEFVYFDPENKEYVTLYTDPLSINVKKGTSVGINEIARRNDIHDINLSSKELTKNPVFIIDTFWYWLIYIVIILMFLGVVVVRKKQIKFNSDITNIKLAKANKVAQKRLKLAQKYMISKNEKQFYEEIVNAIWGYLSDKLAIPTSQLLRENIMTELSKLGADESLCGEVINILNECDMAIYSSQSTTIQVDEIYNKTIDIIDKIESIKQK